MNIKVISVSPFTSIQNRFAVAYIDVMFTIDDIRKQARLGISGPDLSVLKNEKSDKETIELVKASIENMTPSDISFEIDNTFYYWYTGSHFQIQDKKPDWATI